MIHPESGGSPLLQQGEAGLQSSGKAIHSERTGFSPGFSRPALNCMITGEPSGGTCYSPSVASNLNGSATLPFVIPTGAERSGGICSSTDPSWKCFSTAEGSAFPPLIHPRQTSATIRTCSGPVRQHPPIHCAPAFRHLFASSPKSLICPSPCQHRSTASHSSPELG